jgi:glucokinase
MSLIMVQRSTLAIAVDIGGTNLRFALVDAAGRILSRNRTLSRIDQGRDPFCRRLLEGISGMEREAAASGASVAGIGVGVPGLVGRDGMIHASVNMRPLDGFVLSRFLEQQTALPSTCDNDANLIAKGEAVHGAGRGLSSFVVITLGTGVGSGLVLDGRIWNGVGGFAAEFGHVTVEPEGAPCSCGNRGCLEQYASASAIARIAGELLKGGQLDDVSPLDAARVAQLACQGRVEAQRAFEVAGRYLGIALASLTTTLNLEAAIICGGVAPSLELMLPSLVNELRMRCFPQILADFSILRGELGDDAGLLGAAATIRARVAHDIPGVPLIS